MRSLCDIFDVCRSYLKNLYDVCRFLTFVVVVEIGVVTFVVEKRQLRVLWHLWRLSSRQPSLPVLITVQIIVKGQGICLNSCNHWIWLSSMPITENFRFGLDNEICEKPLWTWVMYSKVRETAYQQFFPRQCWICYRKYSYLGCVQIDGQKLTLHINRRSK